MWRQSGGGASCVKKKDRRKKAEENTSTGHSHRISGTSERRRVEAHTRCVGSTRGCYWRSGWPAREFGHGRCVSSVAWRCALWIPHLCRAPRGMPVIARTQRERTSETRHRRRKGGPPKVSVPHDHRCTGHRAAPPCQLRQGPKRIADSLECVCNAACSFGWWTEICPSVPEEDSYPPVGCNRQLDPP